MEIFKMKQVGLFITNKCNRMCRMCSGLIPYRIQQSEVSVDRVIKIIDELFEVIDEIEKITLCGGETFLHSDLDTILEHLNKYYIHRFETIEIFTNGSIVPKNQVVDSLEKMRKKVFVFIDDYGIELSDKINDVERKLSEKNIKYTVRSYKQEDPHCGGWVEFGDFAKEKKNIKECVFAKGKLPSFGTTDGIFYPCTPARIMVEHQFQKLPSEEYFDIFDQSMNKEQKRKKIMDIVSRKKYYACTYCNGMGDLSKRIIPAEQLKSDELIYIKQGAKNYYDIIRMKEGHENE